MSRHQIGYAEPLFNHQSNTLLLAAFCLLLLLCVVCAFLVTHTNQIKFVRSDKIQRREGAMMQKVVLACVFALATLSVVNAGVCMRVLFFLLSLFDFIRYGSSFFIFATPRHPRCLYLCVSEIEFAMACYLCACVRGRFVRSLVFSLHMPAFTRAHPHTSPLCSFLS